MKLLHKIDRKSVWLLIILVLAILAALTFVQITQLRKDRFDCSSYLEMDSDVYSFSADLNTYFLIDGNRKGYFNVSGIVHHNKTVYTVERSYRFDYEVQKQGIYVLTDFSVARREADNAIDDIMDKVFIGPEAKHGLYLKIKPIGNAMVIEGVYSPSLMCVLH